MSTPTNPLQGPQCEAVFEQGLRDAVASAKRCADSGIKLAGHALPTVVVAYAHFPEGELERQTCLIGLPAEFGGLDSVSKRAHMHRLGADLRRKRHAPLAVAVMFEAWVSIEVEGRRRHILPEDDPDRTSHVVVFAASTTGQWTMARREERTPGEFGPWQTDHAAKVHSPLIAAVYRGWMKASDKQRRTQ